MFHDLRPLPILAVCWWLAVEYGRLAQAGGRKKFSEIHPRLKVALHPRDFAACGWVFPTMRASEPLAPGPRDSLARAPRSCRPPPRVCQSRLTYTASTTIRFVVSEALGSTQGDSASNQSGDLRSGLSSQEGNCRVGAVAGEIPASSRAVVALGGGQDFAVKLLRWILRLL